MTATGPVPSAVNDAKAALDQYLKQWDLQALGEWAWQRYKETDSLDLVMLEMQERPEYKERFAGRIALAKQGFHMSEAEQLAWENQAMATMRASGMPVGFYDSWRDMQPLIATGMSNVELADRVNNAFTAVVHATSPEVRQIFGEYYGANSDAAIASMMLDVKKSLPMIRQQVAAAEAGGYIRQQGYQITRTLAESIALATGADPTEYRAASEKVGLLGRGGLFDQRFGETEHATVDTAAEALLAHDSQSEYELQRAMDLRESSTKGTEAQSSQGFGKAHP